MKIHGLLISFIFLIGLALCGQVYAVNETPEETCEKNPEPGIADLHLSIVPVYYFPKKIQLSPQVVFLHYPPYLPQPSLFEEDEEDDLGKTLCQKAGYPAYLPGGLVLKEEKVLGLQCSSVPLSSLAGYPGLPLATGLLMLKAPAALKLGKLLDHFLWEKLGPLDKKGEKHDPTAMAETFDYFTGEERPLEKLNQTFQLLNPAQIPEKKKFLDQMMGLLMEYAYFQHMENPEKYVSHGLNHSLNVAQYIRDLYQKDPRLLKAMTDHYPVTSDEAKFLLEMVALLHDIGYPHLRGRAKSYHAIAGADLARPMIELFPFLLGGNPEKLDQLKEDFYNAIFSHSADKVDKVYTHKIETDHGSFLADEKNQEKVAEILSETRNVRKVHHHEAGFPGRKTDLLSKEDDLIGIPLLPAEILDNPLMVLRVADNMDMTATQRFSPLQKQEAFLEILTLLGGGGPVTQITKALENWVSEMNPEPKDSRTKLKEFFTKYWPEGPQKEILRHLPADDFSLQQFLQEWSVAVSKFVLSQPKFRHLAKAIKSKLKKLGRILCSQDFKYFGSCLPMKRVFITVEKNGALKVVVVVNEGLYQKMNENKIVEKEYSLEKGHSVTEVGVGEYQLQRAQKSFETLTMDHHEILLELINENGETLSSPYTTLSDI